MVIVVRSTRFFSLHLHSVAWEYEHLKLNKQLDAGVRFLELDLYPDPEGGKYSSPAALKLAGIPARLDDPAYQEPGWKVLHIPDIGTLRYWNTKLCCFTPLGKHFMPSIY